MSNVGKGVVTQFAEGKPVVRPFGAGNALTPPMIDSVGVQIGDQVAFAIFEDGTGVVLAKMI